MECKQTARRLHGQIRDGERSGPVCERGLWARRERGLAAPRPPSEGRRCCGCAVASGPSRVTSGDVSEPAQGLLCHRQRAEAPGPRRRPDEPGRRHEASLSRYQRGPCGRSGDGRHRVRGGGRHAARERRGAHAVCRSPHDAARCPARPLRAAGDLAVRGGSLRRGRTGLAARGADGHGRPRRGPTGDDRAHAPAAVLRHRPPPGIGAADRPWCRARRPAS